MKKIIISLVSLSLGAFLISCGAGSGSSTDSSESLSQLSGALSESAEVMDKVVPDTSGVPLAAGALGAILTGPFTNTGYGLGGDYGDDPRAYLQKQGDDTAQGSLMFRFKQAVMENICMFSYFLPSTAGVVDLAPLGSTIVINASDVTGAGATALQTQCPEVATATLTYLAGIAPLTIRYGAEDISAVGGTEYERKVSFDVGNSGTYNDLFFFTINSSLIKFAYIERQLTDVTKGGSYAAFEFDKSADIGKFEYVSFDLDTPSNRHDVFRAFYDGGSNYSAYLARSNNSNATPDVIRVSAVTAASSATELATSFGVVDDSLADVVDGNACISNSTLNIVTDNTLTCTGATGLAVSGFTSEASFTGIIKTDFAAIDETYSIQFTSSANFLSAGPFQ